MNGHLALGLMSGTSADGVSAALASFNGHNFEFLGLHTEPYPEGVVRQIRQRAALPVGQMSRLHVEIGEAFAHAANKLIKKLHVSPDKIECIGSHGQTIYHGPHDIVPNTLQLGEPAVIAERTGITVVSNFRGRDIAVGGEGAPLIPYFDQYFYGNGPVRAFQNIGGIGNVTIVGHGIETPLAFDTGPGNCLMDLAMRMITHGKEDHDHNGARAKHGQINMAVVSEMLLHPYFKKAPPKSTGLEMFGEDFLNRHLNDTFREKPDDLLATLNYFTCITIQESYRNFVFKKHPVTEIVISGGGLYNKTLVKKLECLFAPIPVVSIEKFGYPTLAKEPLAFAFFGLRALQHKSNHLPATTGAKHARILGSITRA